MPGYLIMKGNGTHFYANDIRMGGKVWIKQMLTSAFFLPFVVCGTAFFINFIAIYYHASRAIPFGTMVGDEMLLKVSNFLPVFRLQLLASVCLSSCL